MRLVSTIRRPMRSLRPAGGRVARASAIFHCPSEPEAGGERDRARRLPKSGSHMTQRWRKPDSNLYGAFPVKWSFFGFLPVLCSELESRSSSRRLGSGSRSARKGSRDRNGSKAWRLAA